MSAGVKSVWALFIGVAVLALGNGLQNTLLGVRATDAEFGTTVTGLVMAGYFVGTLVGSLITPTLIQQVGHIRVFAAFASIVSTSALLHAVFVDPYAWFAFRAITGFCIAGLYIVSESWVNSASTNETRGKFLSAYMLIIFAAMGVGQLLLNVPDHNGFILFIVVSALMSVALVPMSLARTPAPEIDNPRPVTIAQIYALSPLAVTACFFNGLGQSAFFSLGAVYGQASGLSVGQVSILMALPMLGVIASQFPVGMVSDSFDRRRVMTVIAALTAGFAFLGFFSTDWPYRYQVALFGIFGALSLPLYSLALAHANDYLESDQMLGAAGKLVLLFGVGAIAGPVIAGQLMELLGAQAFFLFLGLVYGLIAVFALYRMTRRPSLPLEEQGDFVLVSQQTTPIAATAIAIETTEGLEDDSARAP
ncbi:MAG: MFS transporter [Pseudomonadota bacterium]